MDELSLAYVLSIHKSQGSEFPCVVIPIHTQHFIMLQRNLLYTAVTRGKKLVVLVGTLFTLPLVAQQPADQPRSEVQLVEATVYELQHALRTGLLTSEQLVQMYLARIDAYEPLVNAFIHINPNALEEARALDARRKRGVPMGPLYGIPVLLKDNIDTHDMPTTAGSIALEGVNL